MKSPAAVRLAPILCALALTVPFPAAAQRIYGTYRVIPAGETAKLGLHYLIGDDCRSRGAVQVNVIASPTGGEILTLVGTGHPRVPSASKLARCNVRTVAGTNVFYRAAPGYTGTDRFVLEDVYPDGTARQFPVTVSVR